MSSMPSPRPCRGAPLTLLLGLLALPAAFAAAAASSSPLAIETAMREAVAQAPLLGAQDARIESARQSALRADALPDPKLVLAVDNLPIDGPMAGSFGADLMTMRRIGLMQDWPLRSKRDAWRSEAEAKVAEAESAASALALGVARAAAEAWIELWAAQAGLALLVELREEGARAVASAEARLRGGGDAAVDALAARAALVALDNRIAAAGARIDAATAGLARWLGPAAVSTELAEPQFDRLRVPAERLRAQIDAHAELALWLRREDGAAAALHSAHTERRPDLSLGIAYGARSAGRDDMLMLEVGIGLPLFPRQRQDRDIAARAADLDAVRADREDARRVRIAELDARLAEWRSWREQAARYRDELLPLARDRSRLALAGFGAGGALRPWFEARDDEIDARLAYLDVMQALGRSWAWLATLLPEDAP